MNRSAFRQAFRDTVPVLTGYIFMGIGFGILLRQAGYGPVWALSMRLFMYAGSGQYLAVALLRKGASLLSTALATALVNARHLFYGLSLVDTYKDAGPRKFYMIFSLTDETYSLVTQNKVPQGMSRIGYCFLVSAMDQLYWVVGCVLGSLLGQLPVDFTGVEFVLTALFVTLLVEQWLSHKNHLPALIGLGSTALCLAVFGAEIFLIPSMGVIAALLTISRKTGRRMEDD